MLGGGNLVVLGFGTLDAGLDLRHGLIGPGVYASHGYERSHLDRVRNTLKVLKGYLDL